MALKVIWSHKAKNNFLTILDYIDRSFGEEASKNYYKNVESLISLLAKFPEIGNLQNPKLNLRGVILYRRTTVFYTFNQKRVLIVNVIDNRHQK